MNNKLKLTTIEEVKEKIMPVLRKYNPEKVYIFGSLARGEYTSKSDIDILVKFREPISLLEHAGIEIELSDILSAKVDLITEEGLHPYLKKNVMKDAKAVL